MASAKKTSLKASSAGSSSKTSRRDDPKKSRAQSLKYGSEQEIGARLLSILKLEGGNHAPIATEGSIWEYQPDKGLWAEVPIDVLHRIVGQFDGSTFEENHREKTLRISNAFAKGAIHRAEFQAMQPNFFAEQTPALVFANGAVRIHQGSAQLSKHSPEHCARAGYPFDFNPHAKAPRFERMLREHFSTDEDSKQKIACLQEFFGACLFGVATKFQKCLALPSDGGGGRSTMLEIIERAMPEGSVAHVEAKELRKPERRAKLPSKRLNFSDEVPPDAFLESEDFKKIVVGNVVTAEEKYRPSFEFRPIAGLVFPIQISASAELSDAFFRRFIIVRYNRNFEGDKNRDYDLADKVIAQELPGVVAWMVEGVVRRLNNGVYTIPDSHFIEESKWKLSADTVRACLDTVFTKSLFELPRDQGYDETGKPNGKPRIPHDWTAASDLYSRYQEWCAENGHRKPVAIQEFRRRVEKVGYLPERTHRGIFYGVRLLETAQKKADEEAKKAGTPPEGLPGAVEMTNGAILRVVK